MDSLKPCLIFMVLVIQTKINYGQDITKSSLTFVIDDTGSMGGEINQVKESVNSIFDSVVNSNKSQIENFILVTFNDPSEEELVSWNTGFVKKQTQAPVSHKDWNQYYVIQEDYVFIAFKSPLRENTINAIIIITLDFGAAALLTITNDRHIFKSKLQEIYVDGGGDCAEYAMKGIKLALQNSLPFSYLYVFTDASAKDHSEFEEMIRLSRKKQIEVNFLLTGICGNRNDADYQVYKKLAKATSGEVYNMEKGDVKDVIKYIEDKITERSNGIFEAVFPPGKNTFTFIADSKMNDIVISVSGLTPKVQIISPDGEKVKTKVIVDKHEIAVIKITEIKPGVYTVEIDSPSESSVKVTGKTDINFEHGFSSFEPTSLSDTATRPPPDGNTHLSIQLRGEGVELKTVELRDESGGVLNELPLRLINNETNFYVTDLFDPPKTIFRLLVSGVDLKTNTPVDRLGTTPIERQNAALEKPINVAPVVTIDGSPTIIIDYNAPVQLKCKVHGYPKPLIIWQEKDTGMIVATKVFTIEAPYDYISILNKDKLKKNISYECKATNPLGESFSSIAVQPNSYFKALETPKGKTLIEYDKMGSIPCIVDAKPPATITWYKDGKLLSNDSNIVINNNMTAVTIKRMDFKDQGRYTCEVENELQKSVYSTNVVEFGSENPEIEKIETDISAVKGEDVQIQCRILKGNPYPTIQWYFQAKDDSTFITLNETSEILTLKHVTTDHVGTYLCRASNKLGLTDYAVEFTVEYPPEIEEDGLSRMQVKDGEVVTIPCKVDGVPRPIVKWFINDSPLLSTKEHRINKHNLRFHAMKVSNAGHYMCRAENHYGVKEKNIIVDVIVPANIEVPRETHIETTVGQSLLLPCRADGYPQPKINWFRRRYDENAPKHIKSFINATVFGITHIQLKDQGYYTCTARNVGKPARLTYNVTIYAPPAIEEYPDRSFEAVIGDISLRVPCNATGNPKPTITWQYNNLNIAYGTEWYDLEDGTLIIKNIRNKTPGTYVCVAQNKLGKATMAFDVTVTDYPNVDKYPTTKLVEAGTSANIECDIPHSKTDLIRWFKNGELIATDELILNNVKSSDSGIYTCRVSNLISSSSSHVNVIVGQKPYFVKHEEEIIDFVEGDVVIMSCEASGDPNPKVSWQQNGKNIDVADVNFDIEVEMKLNNRGMYSCEVSNDLGSIKRSFNIVSKDCFLNVKEDFLGNGQSLLLSSGGSLTWAPFQVIDGYMIIEKEKPLRMHCSHGFQMFPANKTIVGYCENETNIKINGNIFQYEELKCKGEATPTTQSKHINCLPGNTEYLQVGYNVEGAFLDVYDVCFDKDDNVPLYTQHKLFSARYDGTENTNKWYKDPLLPFDFDTMYDCVTQVEDISATLGKPFHPYDKCCYDKRQLVNPKDLRPGIPPAVAYSYLNVVPHWSTCNSKNWAKIEEIIRDLATTAGRELIISTGTAKSIRSTSSGDIRIHDKRGRTQPIAESLWKVVQDPVSKSSLAIIQINVPDISRAEASKYVRCRDICHWVDWMRNSNWQNVADGYTYCCSILEFESAFNYDGQFSGDMTTVLNTHHLSPHFGYSLTV